MAGRPFEPADLEALRRWDTPTICNALEIVAPARRGRVDQQREAAAHSLAAAAAARARSAAAWPRSAPRS